MKSLLVLLLVSASFYLSAQQNGYEIKLTFKPFANQYVFLGHYEGKQLPIIDSVKLDERSQG
ncbi:MAG TPA: hypothetical protein VGC95_03730, partial [Chitinophagaceae bacterium]